MNTAADSGRGADATAVAVRARAADVGPLRRLMQEVWGMEEPPDEAQVALAVERTTVMIVRGERQGEEHVLALGSAFRTSAPDGALRWEVDLIGTAPGARKQGLAALLLSALLSAGREAQGHSLARALIRDDNRASQRLFERAGFCLQEEDCCIWTRDADFGVTKAREPGVRDGHAVKVDTLLYAGVWLEQIPRTAHDKEVDLVLAAGHTVGGEGRVLGAVVPTSCSAVSEALQERGFSVECSATGQRQCYQWWHMQL